jgi:hypothetical protein
MAFRHAVALLAVCASAASAANAATDAPRAPTRGDYLVATSGCSDCHTPMKMGPKGPEPDLARGLSGHPQGATLPPPPAAQGPWLWGGSATNTAFWGPWGVSYASNLTPDAQTGIGAWKVDDFVRAMRSGKHFGNGRPILPPMPWPMLSQMTDADLRAIFASLTARPAVKNLVPQAVVAPPPKP